MLVSYCQSIPQERVQKVETSKINFDTTWTIYQEYILMVMDPQISFQISPNKCYISKRGNSFHSILLEIFLVNPIQEIGGNY